MPKKTANLSRHVALLRIIFGLMWAVDAVFKWQPTFRDSFLDQVRSAAQGQPSWLGWWFNFWVHLLMHNPYLFAVFIALAESAIAIALLVGLARRTTYLCAALFSLLIWSVAEGFGGPYTNGSTDIGTGIIYAVVFFALYGLERLAITPTWSIDAYIGKRFPWWAMIANP